MTWSVPGGETNESFGSIGDAASRVPVIKLSMQSGFGGTLLMETSGDGSGIKIM